MTDDDGASAWLSRGLIGTVMALAAGLLIAAALYPYQTSYVEGFMLDQARRVADGTGLYRALGGAPWVIDNFPPLYLWLLGGLYSLAGASFLPGRLLTLAALAGLCILAWRINRHLGPSALVAWGATALWLIGPYVLRRGMLLRMDFAAILLAASGLWLYIVGQRRNAPWTLPAAAGLFLAALFTRQTMVAAPAALAFGLWLRGQRRAAAMLAAVVGSAGLVLLLVFQAAYGDFLGHVVGSNLGGLDGGKLAIRYWVLLKWHFPLLAMGILGAWALARDDSLEGRVLPIWFVLAALMSLTVGKNGSSANHFLELLFVCACLAGAGIRQAAAWLGPRLRPMAQPAPWLILLLSAQATVAAVSTPVHEGIDALGQREADEALVAVLAATEGPVLSENAGAAVQAGHPLLLEPRTFHALHEAGAWDDAPLVENISRQAYQVIVIETFPPDDRRYTGFRFTPDTWTAIRESYAPGERLGKWQVWRPEVA